MTELKNEILSRITAATDEAALEAVRVSSLGKKGDISLKMRELGSMTPDERQVAGPALNTLKLDVTDALNARRADLAAAALEAKLASEWVDVSQPARPRRNGSVHPVSQATEEIISIFAELGFSVAEGPQIETDFYNFDALNIPAEHPARTEMDTFYMHREAGDNRPPHVLRTHTSPVQIRHMEEHGAPCRIIAPGRVYRADYDQTHTPMFHQVEGLAIDSDISMANLKWTLQEFCRAFFEVDGVEIRFRASHFPFTEPSAEIDIQCSWDSGVLKIGEGNDWLEAGGSGMVHPDVLKHAGVDPDRWQGFAFGLGIDRLAMLKYGIPDLRAFFDSDLRWLRHYGFRSLEQPGAAR
ncbi:MAG: phenylalanine--tRNA ligase subunit alpha [Pseudomonadota bacterium]